MKRVETRYNSDRVTERGSDSPDQADDNLSAL
jgi:hypothetical protein